MKPDRLPAGGRHGWLDTARRLLHRAAPARTEPVIGLALSGGFARAIAHVGVLRVFEQHHVPVHLIAGVSAGAIVAAAWASGRDSDAIGSVAHSMKFSDVARWRLSLMGLADSARMAPFLIRLLKVHRFEEMRLPLAVVATDLGTGQPAVFRGQGDVLLPVRASCSYPGLFVPVRTGGRCLVDGAISMETPSAVLREMGATHVIAVTLPVDQANCDPRNMFQVVNRCFQILQGRTEWQWRKHSNLVIEPELHGMAWDCFPSAEKLIRAGEAAALAVLPRIRGWLEMAAPQAA